MIRASWLAASAACFVLSFAGCGGDDAQRDGSVRRDLGVVADSGPADADEVPMDAAQMDAAQMDAAQMDAAQMDAAQMDAAQMDAAQTDAAEMDAEITDADQPDAVVIGDADVPDAIFPDSGVPDAISPDSGVPDAGADAGVDSGVDAGVDAGIDAGVDAGVPFTQGGGIVISELAARSTPEWLELHNTTAATTFNLTTYSSAIFSQTTGALVIRAAADPNGTNGTPVSLAPGAYAIGAINPANAADIPQNATFVIGTPGQLGANAFADTGDMITLAGPNANGDLLDFRTAVTDPAVLIGATDFPLPADLSIALDIASDTTGGELLNDNGGVWCADVFRGATPGAANRSCRDFVISELTYDYDSITTGVDDGQEFIELAGPAGGPLANVILTRVEGTGAATVDGELSITGARMPLDGLYVVADDNPLGGPTQVANADQIVNLVMENGPDAVQLVRLDANAVLLDAFAYGAVASSVDNTRGLPIIEGTAAPDPAPTSYTTNLARSDGELDTNNNAADFRYDPSPTPGARNGVSTFALTSITPNDSTAGTGRIAAAFTIEGSDFTDLMTLSFGQTPAPAIACVAPTVPNRQSCSATYPAAGSGLPERVNVTLAARVEHGGVSTITNGFTWTLPNNETNTAVECDFCNLQFPPAIAVAAGQTSPVIYGQIYEAGLTDVTVGGPAPGILAEVGYGASGSDPRVVDWTWSPATFNVETGINNNNDEYQGTFTAPGAGTYGLTYRYSLDGGLTWSYADLDGAGSNGGLSFDPPQVGVLTVN